MTEKNGEKKPPPPPKRPDVNKIFKPTIEGGNRGGTPSGGKQPTRGYVKEV